MIESFENLLYNIIEFLDIWWTCDWVYDLVTGKDFKIEPSDSFEVQLYADENDIPCFKSVSWKKLQGGVPFQQNSILPGDQLLCKFINCGHFKVETG